MTIKRIQPTYKRQRFLLSYISQINNGVTATEIQKLIFLWTMKEENYFYDFIPYKYGPYSFQLAEDIEILCKNKYLHRDGKFIKAISNYESDSSFAIPIERGDNLLRKTYIEYPYFTINSEIINRLFAGSETDFFSNEKNKYLKNTQMLFTIGYEGKSIESFMNLLIKNDVKVLCDIRKNPISRKFGFSKRKLDYITDKIGIKYIHIPSLGIESEKRHTLESLNDYRILFDDYEKILPSLDKYLESIYYLLCSNYRIAIMCYEKNPEMCHRHVVRDYLIKTYQIRSIDL